MKLKWYVFCGIPATILWTQQEGKKHKTNYSQRRFTGEGMIFSSYSEALRVLT